MFKNVLLLYTNKKMKETISFAIAKKKKDKLNKGSEEPHWKLQDIERKWSRHRNEKTFHFHVLGKST